MSKFQYFDRLKFMVQDDPKLLDDARKIPKSQGRGWWFNSQR